MSKPHRWADVIKAWADGKPIQWRVQNTWQDYYPERANSPNFDDVRLLWRIKPNTVKYRRYLWRSLTNCFVGVYHHPDDAALDSCPSFIRWIDDEWQEVEV